MSSQLHAGFPGKESSLTQHRVMEDKVVGRKGEVPERLAGFFFLLVHGCVCMRG